MDNDLKNGIGSLQAQIIIDFSFMISKFFQYN